MAVTVRPSRRMPAAVMGAALAEARKSGRLGSSATSPRDDGIPEGRLGRWKLRPEFTFAPEAQPFAPEAQPFEIRDVFGLLHSHQRANGWDPKRLIEKFENFATVRPQKVWANLRGGQTLGGSEEIFLSLLTRGAARQKRRFLPKTR